MLSFGVLLLESTFRRVVLCCVVLRCVALLCVLVLCVELFGVV